MKRVRKWTAFPPSATALVRSRVDKSRIEGLMEAIGRAARSSGRVYFTGGTTAVLRDWRETTIDVDLKLDPEPEGILEALPKMKERFDVNVELAAPSDFVPELPGWRERSVFIARHGPVDFFHYDFYGQALSKIERYHERDRDDLRHILSSGLIDRARLGDLFRTIEPQLIRYPAIDPESLGKRVMEMTMKGGP